MRDDHKCSDFTHRQMISGHIGVITCLLMVKSEKDMVDSQLF